MEVKASSKLIRTCDSATIDFGRNYNGTHLIIRDSQP